MTLSRDDRQLQRYLDGELAGEERAAFSARLLADADLRERFERAQGLRQPFAKLRAEAPAGAPADFTASVLAEVRRLPDRALLEQQDVTSATMRLCRRMLLAAAVLCAIGIAWHAGLLDRGASATVEAAPDDVQREMERLDELILDALEAPRRGR